MMDRTDSQQNDSIPTETAGISMAAFLESSPPNVLAEINHVANRDLRLNAHHLYTPDIQLHCDGKLCGGMRSFSCRSQDLTIVPKKAHSAFLPYTCRNCQRTSKTYAISVVWDGERRNGKARKFGEWPEFGPPTPPGVIKLIGPDREIFLKGRRAENQGMGIGAFAYYRRVVGNNKDRILDEMIRAAQRLDSSEELIQQLGSARHETQFIKAIGSIKHVLPQDLLIGGHSPLALLHSALSKGVHDRTDEECLELARYIRTILVKITEQIAHVLKDEAELKAAVNHLLRFKSKVKLLLNS